MVRRGFHILLLLCVFLVQGCVIDLGPALGGGSGIVLTIQCEEAALTKAGPEDRPGENDYNENLIKTVDFIFYSGSNPDPDGEAAYHIRKVLDTPAQTQEVFNLVIKKNIIENIFALEGSQRKATVYVLVNNLDESFLDGSTSMKSIAQKRVETDFAATETGYLQSCFLMDGKVVLSYNANASSEQVVEGTVPVQRFAAKLSVAVKVAPDVYLKHIIKYDSNNQPYTEDDELWHPVLHTMRLYLVDGVKTVQLGSVLNAGESNETVVLPDPAASDPRASVTPAVATADYYFSYYDSDRNIDRRRPFVENDNVTPSVKMSSEAGHTDYYETWPMYTYPREWTSSQWDYPNVDYTAGKPHEQPYLKLEMDWQRDDSYNHYSYDLRKYYYKIYLPFEADKFERNHWYSLFLDIGILGSETDEGMVVLTPSCYILDWQNKSEVVNPLAVIAAARYLSVDKAEWELHNETGLSIPFISSHNVKIIENSIKVTRPFYGVVSAADKAQFDSNPDYSYYNDTYHASVKRNAAGGYYLDYSDQPVGKEQYKPDSWLEAKSTWIQFTHSLVPDYTQSNFDYSPYTIEFDINHDDLTNPSTFTYNQYLKHIKIVQYPAIYIEAIRNSDSEIIHIRGSVDNNGVYGYATGEEPWLDKPWGYTYVNAGRGRILRQYKDNRNKDPFFKLSNDNSKREYQWQTVYYSGGARDMFTIHVTVLPSTSSFVIGDPRTDGIDNLENRTPYHFSTDNANDIAILGYNERTGFFPSQALYGDSPRGLQFYYPTENSDRTKTMLAPSYRFSSKFNGTEYGGNEFGNMTKDYAEYRCAAYQEDGFPAGRWRLPTKAEIHFVAQLSAKGAFDKLFSNSTFWSANGAITVNGSSVSDSDAQTALLRCVYDAWYWDTYDENNNVVKPAPREQFTWGDRPR